MSSVKCFDVTSKVIDEASDRFGPLWKVDEEKLNILRQYCGAIDSISRDFDGESLEVEVDEISMDVSITLECGEMVITSGNHVFFQLAERSTKFSFSVSGDDMLLVRFVFPSVWEKT